MNIPVFKKEDRSIHWIDVHDICYFSIEVKQIVCHTKDGSYYYLRSLEEILTALQSLGFEKLDRASVVQLDNITQYDSEFGKVFFDDEINDDSLYATVSSKYMKKVIAKLGPDKDIAKKK